MLFHLFEIKAAVKVAGDRKIRSGYSANAEMVLESRKQVLAVPESTVEFAGDSTFVYVKADKDYTRKLITTGLSDGLNIEILSGISENEVVRGSKIIKE